MKKQMTAILLAVLLCLGSIPVSAEDSSSAAQAIYFSDGSYITIELIDGPDQIETDRGRTSVTKSKAATYYRSDGVKAFTLTVTGIFTYDGTTSACTSSTYSYTLHESEWSLKTGSASYIGNAASATGTFVRKVLGITVSTKILTVTLSCSPSGIFS